MKSIKLTLAVLVTVGTLFVSCKKETSEGQTTATATATKEIANAQTTSFTIDGMTCAVGCAKTIETKLAGLEGVQKATVDFDKKTATIEYDATVQTPEKLVETVEAVADGKTYKVSNVKSSGDKAMLFQEKPKKKAKKANTSEASTTTTPVAQKEGEKKAGCCAGKKACSADKKEAGVL
ncbi:heavy-metal-associated domain-containing protein [Flavobacterium humi]|uniref:Cation transporter n=1 Tax=Flavobacterium humi TaxID=2562683 RepID=A0A4Z0LAK8_9FLAO|nr:heavy-metal-associated domain-containing protein [Flavobacterium humi]TGD58417.1 cation transporter [Flavobacterium humi]